ncbi:MAG: hypothetical protein V4659_06745, partial [Pseudomonadota bacterium]
NYHYFANKRRVIGLVLACNAPLFLYQLPQWSRETTVLNLVWLALMLATLIAWGKRANYVALSALVLLYIYIFWA